MRHHIVHLPRDPVALLLGRQTTGGVPLPLQGFGALPQCGHQVRALALEHPRRERGDHERPRGDRLRNHVDDVTGLEAAVERPVVRADRASDHRQGEPRPPQPPIPVGRHRIEQHDGRQVVRHHRVHDEQLEHAANDNGHHRCVRAGAPERQRHHRTEQQPYEQQPHRRRHLPHHVGVRQPDHGETENHERPEGVHDHRAGLQPRPRGKDVSHHGNFTHASTVETPAPRRRQTWV